MMKKINMIVENVNNPSQELDLAIETALEESRAKTDFMISLAKEFRTPLSNLRHSVISLKNMQLNQVAQEQIEAVDSSCKTLTNLVNDIHDFIRSEAGTLSLSPTPTSPHTLFNEVIALFKDKATKKVITLDCEIDESVPELLVFDPNRMRQILTNIISNAIKYTMNGGVHIALRPSGEEGIWEVEIEDTSLNIMSQAKHKLESDQNDSDLAQDVVGIDMRLSLCYRLVEVMQGSLRIYSVPEGGNIFKFTFRASNAELEQNFDEFNDDEPVASPAAPKTLSESLKVLLVEDNQFNQLLTTRILQKSKVTPAIANDGLEALEAIERENYDLVLMDLNMPNMDGLTAISKIREMGSKIEQPVIIALTANSFKEDLQACLDVGANDYLSKPFTLQSLMDMINANLK